MVTFTERDGPLEPDEDGHYTCPVCDEYTGEMSSVSAHISGKSDDRHKGKTGKDFQAPDQDGNIRLWPRPWIPDMKPDPDPDPEPETEPDPVMNPEQVTERTGAGIAMVAGAVILYWLVQNSGNDTQMEVF